MTAVRVADILEGMDRTAWSKKDTPRPGLCPFARAKKAVTTFQHQKQLVFVVVDMRRWATTRRRY